MKYDIIVVGAGLGGLTVASRLSVLGYKVGVFEQHYQAGGYASNFRKEGYEFDVSLHGIPGLLDGGNLHRMLSSCKVSERIRALKYEDAYSIRLGEEEIVIPNDIIEYKQMLLERFPHEEQGIRRLFLDLGCFEEGFHKHILGEQGTAKKRFKDTYLYLRWSKKSCYDVVRSYVKDEEFIRIFTAFWPNFGLPPKQLSALTFFITWVSYHYHGKYYIEGGAAKLTDAFLEVMNEYGSEIHYQSNVVRIIDDGKKACGIQLESGEIHYADWIISNANPCHSLSMFQKRFVGSRLVRKVKRYKVGCSLSQLYIGIDCMAKDLGILREEVFTCCGHNHEEDYEMSMKHRYETSGYLLTNYSGMDHSMNRGSHGAITMTYIDEYDSWNLSEDEYLKYKKMVKQQMLERLYRDYPMLNGHVTLAELATPKTMERFTKNLSGAVYGYRADVRQAGRRRLPRNIGIGNFSMVGAWVTPGGGYEGTITGAVMEAHRIHKILKNRD